MAISIEVLAHDAAPQAVEAARDLLLEYGHFVTEAEGPAHFCFGKLREEVDGLPDTYRKQGGEMLMAYANGDTAGCVTWRALPHIGGACEMKRLWVRPPFRRLKLGERLVLAAIEHAMRAGFDAMYLDTFPSSMKPAFDIYLRLGFAPCDPYNDGLYEGIAFMRRPLK
ncbi:MAG TPA: GNAT family N-acetyltransferase [Silvibacterium sp.]|nr:GNAT family N-acetyltransferase [Silvibacterium sp.]